MRSSVDPVRDRLHRRLVELEVPECGCKTPKMPLCVRIYGRLGCVGPGCVSAARPYGCTGPICVAEETPRGCLERRRLGICTCPRRPCGCPKGPCECPSLPGPPCPHVLAANHDYDLDEWLALLRIDDPEDYEGRPPAVWASNVSTRVARVEVLSLREEAGEDLWCLDDVVHLPPPNCAQASTAWEPKNGRVGWRRPYLETQGPDRQVA